MNNFTEFVRKTIENIETAKKIPLGESSFSEIIPRKTDAPVGMIFAPHPDDEIINGGLPLRLFRESGFRILNVPVTLGSNLERRAERRKEVRNACKYLGFEVELADENGFEQITPEGRENNRENWNPAVEKVAEIINKHQPKILFFPHEKDRHPTHCGTNLLVFDALKKIKDFSCVTVENEYWQALENPNCLIELDEKTVADLVAALSFHVGEVARNPFHITFPSWLIDNVRRGSEVVGKAGAEGQNFTFGVLHRISIFKNGKLNSMFENGEFISMKSELDWSASGSLASSR